MSDTDAFDPGRTAAALGPPAPLPRPHPDQEL